MIFSTLIAVVIFCSQVSYANSNGLKQIVDEFQFAVTVEWDQKDQAVYQAKVDEMHAKLAAAKIPQEEVINFLANESKDSNLKKEIQTIVTLITLNQISQSEAQKLANTLIEKQFSQGASWNGRTFLAITGGVLFAALITWTLISSHQCQRDPNAIKTCEIVYECNAPHCGYSEYCSCYN